MDSKKPVKQEQPNVLETATAADAREVRASRAVLARGDALDKYMIVGKLGEGGMGVVYSAYDPDLDRKVALKLLARADGPASRSARTRFLREARAMAKLSHANVITIFEVGTVGDRDFIAMEYIEGTTLDEWMQTKRSPVAVLSVFAQAGRGLAAAHHAGLAHRDFKPSNVLVANDGRVYVTDFGLARSLTDEAEPSASPPQSRAPLGSLTRTGALMGTPAYMSPEQYEGGVDERSDQFSFCVALYQALYGERPFAGDTLEELRQSLSDGKVRAEPAGSEVPGWLRSVVERGLAIVPSRRHGSMDDLLSALSRPPGVKRRRAVVLAAVVAGVVALVVVATGRSYQEADFCEGGVRNLAGAWNDDVRARARTAFSMTGLAYAAEAFGKFEVVVDRYAKDWVSVNRAACLATYKPEGQRAALDDLDRQQQCLRETRNELQALTRAFSGVDRRGIDNAVQAAYGLRKLSECTDFESLRRGVAPPENEEMIADVALMREELVAAQALSDSGRVLEALERAEPVREQAKKVGYKPALAEVEQHLGKFHHLLKHTKSAETAFLAAELAAEETGYDEYRARALVGMTGLLATSSSRFDEARRYGRRAEAAIKGHATDPTLLVDLDLSLAHMDKNEKRFDKALRTLTTRLKVYSDAGDSKPVTVARLESAISVLLFDLVRYPEAVKHAESALAILESELGAGHPDVASAVEAVAGSRRLTGNYDQARALDKRVRSFWQSERGQELARQRYDPQPLGDRPLRGRVLDSEGNPVAAAEVVSGTKMQTDGKYLYVSWGGHVEWMWRTQRVFTDAAGRFEFVSVSEEALYVAAERDQAGRSWPVRISEGKGVPDVTLRLRRFGSVSGKIVQSSETSGSQLAMFVPAGTGKAPSISTPVLVQADGTFKVARLGAGTYELLAGTGRSEASTDLHSRRVTIVADQVNEIELQLERGTVSLSVDVRGDGGAPISSAQIFVFSGHVKASKAKEINQLVFDGANVKMRFTVGSQHSQIDGLNPGRYTVCVLPLAGDFRDPELMKTLTPKRVLDMDTYCLPLRVTAEPKMQTFTAVVPQAK